MSKNVAFGADNMNIIENFEGESSDSEQEEEPPPPRGPKWYGTGGADTYVFDRMLRPGSRSSNEDDSSDDGEGAEGENKVEMDSILPAPQHAVARRDPAKIRQREQMMDSTTQSQRQRLGDTAANPKPMWGNSTALEPSEANSHFVFDKNTRKAQLKRWEKKLAANNKESSAPGSFLSSSSSSSSSSSHAGPLDAQRRRNLEQRVWFPGKVNPSGGVAGKKTEAVVATSGFSQSAMPSSSSSFSSLLQLPTVSSSPSARSTAIAAAADFSATPAACVVRACYLGGVRRLRLPTPLAFRDLEERIAFSFGLGAGLSFAASNRSSSSSSSSTGCPGGGGGVGGTGASSSSSSVVYAQLPGSAQGFVNWGGAAYGGSRGNGYGAPSRTKLCTRGNTAVATAAAGGRLDEEGGGNHHHEECGGGATSGGGGGGGGGDGDDDDLVDTSTFVDDSGFLNFGAGFSLLGRRSSSGRMGLSSSPTLALVAESETTPTSSLESEPSFPSPPRTVPSAGSSLSNHYGSSAGGTRGFGDSGSRGGGLSSRGFSAMSDLTSYAPSSSGGSMMHGDIPRSPYSTSFSSMQMKVEGEGETVAAAAAAGGGAGGFELRMDDGSVTMLIKDDASLAAASRWAQEQGGKTGGVLRVTVQQRNRRPLRSAFKKTQARSWGGSVAASQESQRPSTTERLENYQPQPTAPTESR